jgi:hypothetical protein
VYIGAGIQSLFISLVQKVIIDSKKYKDINCWLRKSGSRRGSHSLYYNIVVMDFWYFTEIMIEKQENNKASPSYQGQEVKDNYQNPKLKESIFVLCESCHWCGTYLNKSYLPADKCPHCFGIELSTFPILPDEAFTFNYNEKRGVELFFGRRRREPAK